MFYNLPKWPKKYQQNATNVETIHLLQTFAKFFFRYLKFWVRQWSKGKWCLACPESKKNKCISQKNWIIYFPFEVESFTAGNKQQTKYRPFNCLLKLNRRKHFKTIQLPGLFSSKWSFAIFTICTKSLILFLFILFKCRKSVTQRHTAKHTKPCWKLEVHIGRAQLVWMGPN